MANVWLKRPRVRAGLSSPHISFFTRAVVAALLLILFVVSSSTGSLGPSPAGLVPNTEIANTTFVDLDYTKFPSLPPYQIPVAGAVFVSPLGNDAGAGTMSSPFRTIARALRTASPGGAVVVRGGTYVEVWEAGDYRALVLTQDNFTLMAYPGETVWVKPASGVTQGMVIGTQDLVVRGINLQGFSAVGVLFEAGAKRNRDIVISDLEIMGSDEAIAMWEAASSVDGLLLANLRTDSMIHCGVGPCSDWRLENVTIDAKGTGWGADAFAIESGDNVLVVNMVVLGAGSDGIDTKATRVAVLNSHVEGIDNNAIKLWHGGDVINTMVKRGSQAPVVVERGRFRMLNSTIGFPASLTGQRDYSMILGYDLRLPMEIEIVNSIIANPSGGAWINPESSAISIRNSLFYTADGSEVLTHGDFTANYAGGAAEINQRYGAGNLTVEPRWGADFRPLAASPAIDAGVVLPLGFPVRDHDGNRRVLGSAPDLGAFEFGGTPPASASAPGTAPGGPPPDPPPVRESPAPPDTSQPGQVPPASPATAAASQATLSEDFEGPLDSSWQFVGSGIQVQGERLTCEKKPQEGPTGAAWSIPQMAAYALSFDYTHGAGIGAVVLGLSDTGTQYRVWFTDDRVQMLRREPGSSELAVEQQVAHQLGYGETHAVTIRVESGRLQVAVNGQQTVDWSDPQPLPSGGLAFGCGTGSGFAFDNITLASLAPTGTISKAEKAKSEMRDLLESAFYGLAEDALKEARPGQVQKDN